MISTFTNPNQPLYLTVVPCPLGSYLEKENKPFGAADTSYWLKQTNTMFHSLAVTNKYDFNHVN